MGHHEEGNTLGMEKIYLDTNQLYYIRRIAEEAQGSDFGSYANGVTH
jgi:hypothetical protein